jgi:hypothetical protein
MNSLARKLGRPATMADLEAVVRDLVGENDIPRPRPD